MGFAIYKGSWLKTRTKDKENYKRRITMKFKSAFAALLLVTMAAFASAQNVPAERDDIIGADVARMIGNSIYYTIYDVVDVEVQNGVITLNGFVTQPYKTNRFIRDINEKFGDTVKVENNITVLPPSSVDDRIRYILARRIYNDSRLLRYSLSRWPYPIHIIVRNGHVRLEGEVGTKMDSRLIETKIRTLTGVVSLTNNLKVS